MRKSPFAACTLSRTFACSCNRKCVSYLFPLKSVETAALGGCKGERNGMKAGPTTFPLPLAPRNMAAFSPRLPEVCVSSRESFIALMEPGYIQQLIWSTRQDRHQDSRLCVCEVSVLLPLPQKHTRTCTNACTHTQPVLPLHGRPS